MHLALDQPRGCPATPHGARLPPLAAATTVSDYPHKPATLAGFSHKAPNDETKRPQKPPASPVRWWTRPDLPSLSQSATGCVAGEPGHPGVGGAADAG